MDPLVIFIVTPSYSSSLGPVSETSQLTHYWVVPVPEHRLNRSLDSVPIFSLLCVPSVMVMFPPFSPLQDLPGFLSLQGILTVSSLFSSYCLLSVCFCVVDRPPPAAAGHPSSVRWKIRVHPSGWLPTKMPFSWCPVQRPVCRFAPPPLPVRLVVLGLGVGGGAKETAPPAINRI